MGFSLSPIPLNETVQNTTLAVSYFDTATEAAAGAFAFLAAHPWHALIGIGAFALIVAIIALSVDHGQDKFRTGLFSVAVYIVVAFMAAILYFYLKVKYAVA